MRKHPLNVTYTSINGLFWALLGGRDQCIYINQHFITPVTVLREWAGAKVCLWLARWIKLLHTSLWWLCCFTCDHRPVVLRPDRRGTSLTCPRSCNCWCCRPWTRGLVASPSSSFRPPFLFLCFSVWYFLTSCVQTLAGESERNSKFYWDSFLNIDSANTIVLTMHIVKSLLRKMSKRIIWLINSLAQCALAKRGSSKGRPLLPFQRLPDSPWAKRNSLNYCCWGWELQRIADLALNCYVEG